MQSFTCPSCGKTSKTKLKIDPGKKGRCPRCNSSFVLIPDHTEFTYVSPEDYESINMNTNTAGSPLINIDIRPTSNFSEREPWFYGHLWTWGSICMAFINACVFTLAVLIVISLIVVAIVDPSSIAMNTIRGILILMTLLVIRFLCLVASALILMLVDMARNIRQQRILEESKQSLLKGSTQ